MFDRVRNYVSNLLVSFKKIPETYYSDIPFYSQWESLELVDNILTRSTQAKDDPKWKDSGARNPEDYQYWSWNLCGVACLKMILKVKSGTELRTIEEAKKIVKFGGYIPNLDGTVDGLYHKPFVRYLDEEHGVESQTANPLSLKRIKYELMLGNYVICSVHQSIRNENVPTPQKKTGHLVLMTGYDEGTQSFTINNPSGYYKKSQKDHNILYKDFERFFSGRGILIKN